MARGALVALLLLSMSAPAANAPSADEDEAVCTLWSAFTAERSFFAERDRYSSTLGEAGLLPFPCADGSRAAAEPGDVAGCRFRFRVHADPPSDPRALQLEALAPVGVRAAHRYVMNAAGELRRDAVVLPRPECGPWVRRADPLWHYHQVVAERDCVGPIASVDDPCYRALEELVALAREGVGAAQRELASHPLARQLISRATRTPAQTLCSPLPVAEAERRAAAQTLDEQGTLVPTVLAASCPDTGVRIGMKRLLTHVSTWCPKDRCLSLFSRAARANTPGAREAIGAHAVDLARLLVDAPAGARRELLSAIGFGDFNVAAVQALASGEHVSPEALRRFPRDPLGSALQEQFEARSAGAAASFALARELQGGPLAPASAYAQWLEAAPCLELEKSSLPGASAERLEQLAAQTRCLRWVTGALVGRVRALPAEELPRLLAPIPDQELAAFTFHLGLEDPARAERLADFVAQRMPDVLRPGFSHPMALTPAVVLRLLSPDNVRALGGPEAAERRLLDLIYRAEEPAKTTLYSEVMRRSPTPELVREVAAQMTAGATKEALFAPLWASARRDLQAAAARGFAEAGAAEIPSAAATACLRELTRRDRCLSAVERSLGPRPPGSSELVGLSETTPINEYCGQWLEAIAPCGGACGLGAPREEARNRLGRAAGAPAPLTDAERACAWDWAR